MKDIKNMVEIINRGVNGYYVSNHLPCDDYVFYFEEKGNNTKHVEIADTINDWDEVVSFEKRGDVSVEDIQALIKLFEREIL